METGFAQDLLNWISDNPAWAGLLIFLVAWVESLIVIGIILPGIFILFGGLISQVPLIGVAGFIASLVGAVLAISNLGGLMNGVISKAQNRGPKRGPGKWSQGFEQRWDRRNLGE